MFAYQIKNLPLNSKRFRCISCIESLVSETMKYFKRYLSDAKNSQNVKILMNQTIPNKKRSIASADLLSIANETRSSMHKNKEPVKPIHYKGEILFGIHPVYLALLERKRHLYQLFIRIYDESNVSLEKIVKINKIENLAKTLKIPVYHLQRREMEYLVPGSIHQGACLDVSPLPVPQWDDGKFAPEHEDSSNLPVWLVLNELLDPMNVGAIIRSSQYFGIDRLFVVKRSSCKLSPTVSKASSGALEVMDIYQVEKLENFLQVKKIQGWNIISTVAYCKEENEVSNQIDITECRRTKPTILILGNEGKGISPEIQRLCDTFVSIPPKNDLHPGIDSLNVSVAAGVILYSLSRRKDSG